jgi:hypothetical protein
MNRYSGRVADDPLEGSGPPFPERASGQSSKGDGIKSWAPSEILFACVGPRSVCLSGLLQRARTFGLGAQ